MKNEIWKDIPGYDGKYQVSTLGRVYSIINNKIMKQGKKPNGYVFVNLTLNSKQFTINVHRLVAITFIPNPNNFPQVNHINKIKNDNRVSNLEWCTNQYNSRYSQAKRVGQFKDGKLIHTYDALIDVIKDGFNYTAISRCCNNKPGYKTCKGFIWKYI